MSEAQRKQLLADLDAAGTRPDTWVTGVRHAGALSQAQIKANLTKFVHAWAGVAKEDGQAPRFWQELLAAFGLDANSVAEFERNAVRASTGREGQIDVLIPGVALIENKRPAANPKRLLDAGEEQGWDYLDGRRVATRGQATIPLSLTPRYVIACTLNHFRIQDILTGSTFDFPLSDLPKRIGVFGFLLGKPSDGESEVELDKHAAELMARVFDELVEDGVDEDVAASVVMRVLFLCVADDLALLGKPRSFSDFLQHHVAESGDDLGVQLQRLFSVVNTPRDKRQASLQEKPHLAVFPYINGSLFTARLDFDIASPSALRAMREAADYDWADVDPAIFGAMFQRMRSRTDRHALGQHYTSERDILRVVEPLFLDDLRDRLDAAAGDIKGLRRFREHLASLQFLDPASGSGNFLLVTFKHLAALDLAALQQIVQLSAGADQSTIGFTSSNDPLAVVSLSQFHGIEVDAWPAEIGRTALYIARAQANHVLLNTLDSLAAVDTLPLPSLGESGGIVHANALTYDWANLVPFRAGTFIFGNPPFLGSNQQSKEQKADQKAIWGRVSGGGSIDFVANWFLLAARHMRGTAARAGFVSTNSITQGEQPAVLWGQLTPLGMGIDFAHRTFPWRNGAGQQAAVHCVIIGFSSTPKPSTRPLWDEHGNRHDATRINAYLLDAPEVLISNRRTPLSPEAQPMVAGSKPTDAGHLSKITQEEADRLCTADPAAAKYLRPLLGAEELINGKKRWCLWLTALTPDDMKASPELQRRINAVRAMREESTDPTTRRDAAAPHLFQMNRQPATSYLAVPSTSSETRPYIPMSMTQADVIANNALLTIADAGLTTFGLLQSRVFTVWNATVSGRLKSDLRISAEITYNNFPFPDLTDTQRAHIEAAAQGVQDARATEPDTSLADLYSPGTFFLRTTLAAAHDALDKAVLDAYGLTSSASDADILQALFTRYQVLTAGDTTP